MTEKKIDSILSSIKGELITNFDEHESIAFVEWAKKLISDTTKDRKEKQLLLQLKNCDNDEMLRKLRAKKKKYLPPNHPYNLSIGDIVHVHYGFGYCSEMSGGHYGIILSDFNANMYFLVPLSSEPLKSYVFFLENLGLPSKNGIVPDKKSYLRFDQMGNVHYRRLENIRGCERKNIGYENLRNVFTGFVNFLKITVDRKFP